MGYSTRSEYTIELLRNPKSYNHIGRRYFATGFILASNINEWALDSILQNWQEIDVVTSNRIRFLFFIDNETTLIGYPNVPYFTESGYKRHHSRLLQVARARGFELSVKAGTQLHNDPFGRKKHSWHPQERVRKLAQQLGVTQLLPCLIWARHDDPDYIYVAKIQETSPEGVSSIIRTFCDQFYDTNVLILSEIDEIERRIEEHCGTLDASLKDLERVPDLLHQKQKINSVLKSLQNLSYSDKTWLLQLEQIAELSEQISALRPIKGYRDFFTLSKETKKWARICKSVYVTLGGKEQRRIPIPYLVKAINTCFAIDIPVEAARLVPQPNPVYNTGLFAEVTEIVSCKLLSGNEDDEEGQNNQRSLKTRIENMLDYLTKRIETEGVQASLTNSNEDIVTMVNISTLLHEITEHNDYAISNLKELSFKIDTIFKDFFCNLTLALSLTLELWMYYRLNEISKYIEEQIRTIVGSIENTKRLYDEPEMWYQQVHEPLSKIEGLVKSLQWNTLLSYEKRQLTRSSFALPIMSEYNPDAENTTDNLRIDVAARTIFSMIPTKKYKPGK